MIKLHSEHGVWTAVVSEKLWESFSLSMLKPAGVECEEQQVPGIAGTQGACLEGTKMDQKIYQENQLSKVPFLLDVRR